MVYSRIKAQGNNFKVIKGDSVFESVSNEIFKHKEYRSAEQYIKQANNLIIDAGAHIGLFTLYCRALNRSVQIISLEPEPKNYKILCENINVNRLVNVQPLKFALAQFSGQGKLILYPDSHNHRLLTSEANALQKRRLITVNTITLNDLLNQNGAERIDFIKMDIEGAEFEIIFSWKPDILKKIRAIMVEYHDDKNHQHQLLDRNLREKGFSVQVFPSKFDKLMGFILAINKKNRRIYGK